MRAWARAGPWSGYQCDSIRLQILVHRVISAKLESSFALLVISLTMLGFALSGVVLTRFRDAFLAHLADSVCSCAALLALCTLGGAIAFYHADVFQAAAARPQFVRLFLAAMPHALFFAIPFAFCGLILGALLSASEFPARRIYFYDLLGSAVGAFAVIGIISRLGVENGLLLSCLVMLVGTVALAPPRATYARALVGIAAVAIALTGAFSGRAFDMRYPTGTLLSVIQHAEPPYRVETAVWDPVARIEVSRIPPLSPEGLGWPSLIGPNRSFHSRFRLMLTQNNTAFTFGVDYDGTKESLKGIEETVYASAYQATSVPHPSVGIVGVGGGFDILNAIYFDASKVTAVEVNAATVSILKDRYGDYFKHWVRDPRLHLVLGEGRNYLTSSNEKYDVLQLSGVDSFSGTPGAAHVFAESYLYTAEAFDLYLSRLTDDGILDMMRLEHWPPREMLRALTTAVAALRRAGVAHPARHIVTLTARPTPNFTALLVKKTPFTAAEVERLSKWANANPFLQVSGSADLAPDANVYQRFLTLDDPRLEDEFVAAYPFDISPAVDDRPFFFKYSFWWHVFPSEAMIWANTPVMEYSTLILLTVVGLAALACVYVPLRYLAGRPGGTPQTRRYGLYFAGAGLGYMAVEIALLQKFGLFLGHPNYALSVVLAALLFASGIGSLFSERIVGIFGAVRFVSYVLAAVILAEYFFIFPRLHSLITIPFAARVLLVFGLVTPIGICLGTFVPTAVERLKPGAPSYIPWAWGINGIFSVLSPILSVAFSMTWGINALLLSGVVVYLATGFALPAVVASTEATPPAGTAA
jgi:spermidine synthase